ncbi:hypothetical protein BaRGS_00013070 [Batillaria attramentaria]|uniref:Endoplasmic reticulum junction formation protein lunapark n=1 Tax=Batillaria attramentaria TaxID=370345 RepID=A0ABD0L814_9CAEN
MGIITSRFREKLSTIEVLEKIDKDISSLQKNRRSNQELQKRIAASLLLYSILLYIVAVVVFYFFYFPDNWPDRALYSLPLVIFPFLIWGARKMMHWYFVKRLAANDLALNELREKRKTVLEEVMEKETYKKAREILEKFDPTRFKKLEKPPSPENPVPSPGTFVRQRANVQQTSPVMATPRRPQMTPMTAVRPGPGAMIMNTPRVPMATPAPGQPIPMRYSPPPGPPMPRTIISRDRGSMEKVIDYLVGDGPQNRYALICRFCASHNGMALPEEFEYLSFRCCYCYNMNQARKMRPFAPKLEFPEVAPEAKPAAGPGRANGHKERSSEEERDASSGLDEEDEGDEEVEKVEKDGERGEKAATRSSSTQLDGTASSARPEGSATSVQKKPSQTNIASEPKGAWSSSAPQKQKGSQGVGAQQQMKMSQASAASQQRGVSQATQQKVLPQASAASQQKGMSQNGTSQQMGASHVKATTQEAGEPHVKQQKISSSTVTTSPKTEVSPSASAIGAGSTPEVTTEGRFQCSEQS